VRVSCIEAIPVAYPEPNDCNAERHLCDAHLGYEHDRDMAFVKALRDAMGGLIRRS
jgi:hypothetical protein